METTSQLGASQQKISRVCEMVLAIVGGIFGLMGGVFAMGVGGVGNALQSGNGDGVVVLGVSALVFSTLAIVAAFFVSSKSKLAGWLLIMAATGGTISVSAFYILPATLLLIAGLMCLLRGRKRAH